ncbi:MAG TPA: YihY family inner membrane protein [Rhodanobacteraceae bacterium]|nr:YihY family inner membrane protein [Rhodanobacteraceae bacterium]
MAARFDRDRAIAFSSFLWKRYLDDKCFETAGALSYTTLFAIVPLMAAILGILSAFPVFGDWSNALTDFVFRNFVPTAGDTIRHYILQFAANASKLTAIGIIVLLASALMMLWAIEDRLNRIWRVKTRRSSVSRFLLYWVALTLGPILVVTGLAVSSYLFALSGAQAEFSPAGPLLRVVSFLVTLIALLAMYKLIPNRVVHWRHAAIGAVLAAVLFEFARMAFGLYVASMDSYKQIYGAVAVVPIFLIWIFISWNIVLLGASIAASLSSFQYRPKSEQLPAGAEFIGLLAVLRHFVEAQREGRGLHSDELCAREEYLSDDLLQRYLGDMQEARLIERSEDGDWMLMRSLDTATLADVYETGEYRLPLEPGIMAKWGADLPPPLREVLNATVDTLRRQLGAQLAGAFPRPESPSSSTTAERP